jgi:hypothetical protein
MLLKTHSQIPTRIAPKAADNPLTTEQISQIAGIFDSDEESELAQARRAWRKFQSSRKRDAVYGYLAAVFAIVLGWKNQRSVKASANRALGETAKRRAIRSDEPFAVAILCTIRSWRRRRKDQEKVVAGASLRRAIQASQSGPDAIHQDQRWYQQSAGRAMTTKIV